MPMFDCVVCHARYEVAADLAGKTIRCRECGRVLAVGTAPVVAARLPDGSGGLLFLVAIAGSALLFVDIGRSLRKMRPKRRGGKR
jgi:hypothetical protein